MRSLAELVRPRAAQLHAPIWQQRGPLWSGPLGREEPVPVEFDEVVERAYKSNSVVFTCILIRQFVLSEARFAFQRIRNRRPDELVDGPGLDLLDYPWPGGTTGELIGRMEQDASLAGQFYGAKVGAAGDRRIRRLRPSWVKIITGVRRDDLEDPDEVPSPFDLRARIIGYSYQPPRTAPTLLTPDQVVHYSPIPDPANQWRGVSWVSAIAAEVDGDRQATRHKARFFRNGATSNLILSYDKAVGIRQVQAFADQFEEEYGGVDNAYRTVHIGGGVDPKTVGLDMKQLDFKVVQGHGESRIAAASLVGAVVAQLSEGMQGSSLNAGNFKVAARRFADIGARPALRMMAASLATIVPPPASHRLWYDDRDIPFFSDDAKDAAEILGTKANAIRTLADGGFDPDAVRDAIDAGDLSLLEHTGLPSVQVQPPPDSGSNAAIRVPAGAVPTLTAAGWAVVAGNGQPTPTGG